MPFIPKNARREYSSETIAVIIALHRANKSHGQIAKELNVPKSSITTIIHRETGNSHHPLRSTKRAGRPLKLNIRARRALIRHVELYPHDSLAALATPSKSGNSLSRGTVRRYLKSSGYLRFKARKKPFLSFKHKQARDS